MRIINEQSYRPAAVRLVGASCRGTGRPAADKRSWAGRIFGLLRGSARCGAAQRNGQVTAGTPSPVPGHKPACLRPGRVQIPGTTGSGSAQAWNTSRQGGDDLEEQVLADLGLSRILPRPTAGD